MRPLHLLLPAALLAGAGVFAATTALTDPTPPAQPGAAVEVRLGYFPNVTHATAIVGVERGLFAKELGDSTKLKTFTFNAGPAAIEALLSGALDATYIGPNPAVNAFVKSHGEAVRVVCGATSGGAALVVDPSIATAADLKGKKLATPQLGNTQDVALRAWLKAQGFELSLTGASEVTVLPQDNAQTLDAFRQHQIAGAWVPEPWGAYLVSEAGAKIIAEEKDLWPDNEFVLTLVITTPKFLREHPDIVQKILAVHRSYTAKLNASAGSLEPELADALFQLTQKKLPPGVVSDALTRIKFTDEPLPASMQAMSQWTTELGFSRDKTALDGLVDTALLRKFQGARDEP